MKKADSSKSTMQQPAKEAGSGESTQRQAAEGNSESLERLSRAADAVTRMVQREKPVKPPKKKSVKAVKPAPKKEWPKGPLTTQQKIWLYGGLFLRALWPLFLYALMPSLCLTLGYLFGGYQEAKYTIEEFFSYGANFYTTVGTFLTLWILHKGAKRRGSTIWEESTLFFREMRPMRAIGFFAFGFASATAVSALVTLLPRFFLTTAYTQAANKLYLGVDLIFMLGTVLFLAPVVEEIIFRGHMLNTLLEHIPEKTAVLISSIIFALLHGSLIWVLYAFLLGQILAKTSMKEDNIAYGVILHIGFNATSVVNFFITDDPVKYNLFFGSKALIAVYGILGVVISLFLAVVYTGQLDLKLLWRRVTGK